MHYLKQVKSKLRRLMGMEFPRLESAIVELNNGDELRKVFRWNLEPVLDDPSIHDFEFVLDVNQRRIRDAESLAAVVRNTKPAVCLDIGTSTGHSAALMSINAPDSKVFTLNIPPEEIASGEGGELTTIALERDKIGSYYRERNLGNITQIYANTARWTPDIGTIDVAFVDGCHDTEFVYNDTRKVLQHMRPGGFVLWHDFNLDLVRRHDWIHAVCRGVEKLLASGLVCGPVYHIRDSWVGIYQVGP